MLALNFDQAVEYFMILTNAELAVILEIVLGDDLPLDAAGMRDLGATAEDLAAARLDIKGDPTISIMLGRNERL